jgi:predicted acetyltransferase
MHIEVTVNDLRAQRLPAGDEFAFTKAVAYHFHESDADDDVRPWTELFRSRFRAWVVRDRDRIVANLGVVESDLSVPGGPPVATAAVTAVGVAQTHRRRGLLRAMMGASLDEAREREEPVAALYASESAIYGRYGFGVLAPTVGYRVERLRTTFRDPVDAHLVEPASPEQAVGEWPAIHEAHRAERSGSIGISPALWRLHVVEDPPSWRNGASSRRLVHVPGRGYAAYRVRGGDEDPFPAGTVELLELVAADPVAEAALWQHACNVDLTSHVDTPLRPPDDLLPELVVDRLALRPRQGPPLYARILDVARAFASRSYEVEDALVIEVVDPDGYTGGTFALEAGPDGASCAPTNASSDLVLPIESVASVWLGGARATTLSGARRIEETTAGAASRLDRLVRTSRAPWSTIIF